MPEDDDRLTGDPAADAQPPGRTALGIPLGCILAFVIFGLLVALTFAVTTSG